MRSIVHNHAWLLHVSLESRIYNWIQENERNRIRVDSKKKKKLTFRFLTKSLEIGDSLNSWESVIESATMTISLLWSNFNEDTDALTHTRSNVEENANPNRWKRERDENRKLLCNVPCISHSPKNPGLSVCVYKYAHARSVKLPPYPWCFFF